MQDPVQEQNGEGQKILVAAQHQKSGRQAILAAAHQLFADNGFHQSSMAELATAAEVSVGQIYRHFKGKEEIIAAMVAADCDARMMEMNALHRRMKAGELTIEACFEALFLMSFEGKDEALSFDIMAEAFRNDAVGTSIGDLCTRYRQIFKDFACAVNPGLSGETLEGAAEMILACIFGLAHRDLSRPQLDADRTARQAARLVVAGLRAMDARRSIV